MATGSLSETIDQLLSASRLLSDERQNLLRAAANSAHELASRQPATLLFVCTHNSRRSQFADVWARVAIAHYQAQKLECASCGTEVTECNPRTVESLKRSGLDITSSGAAENPRYTISLSDVQQDALNTPPALRFDVFSKAFGDAELPTENLIAMMCCDDADHKCPVVNGAEARVALHYRDPKASDGTADEHETYDARSIEIGAEMFFLVREYAQLG